MNGFGKLKTNNFFRHWHGPLKKKGPLVRAFEEKGPIGAGSCPILAPMGVALIFQSPPIEVNSG